MIVGVVCVGTWGRRFFEREMLSGEITKIIRSRIKDDRDINIWSSPFK